MLLAHVGPGTRPDARATRARHQALSDGASADKGRLQAGTAEPSKSGPGGRLCRRKAYDDAKTGGRVRQVGVAAVDAGGLADDGQAEAGAALVTAPSLVQAREPGENAFPVGRRDAGSVVAHRQL